MKYRKPWNEEEIANLKRVHASEHSYKSMMHLWPERTYEAVKDKAAHMNLGLRPCVKHSFSGILAVALIELAREDQTGPDLARRIGCYRYAPAKLLRKNLASEDPKVHIAGWVRSRPGGIYIEVWRLGKGVNAVKPAPQGGPEYLAKRREKHRTRSGRINPFASLAGLVAIPKGQPGRVVVNLWDTPEEIAA